VLKYVAINIVSNDDGSSTERSLAAEATEDQGGDFTPAFLKYFKNGSEKPVFISFSLHFTIVDYYPPSFHFIFTIKIFSENGLFWIS
jgi:hypothetical protein